MRLKMLLTLAAIFFLLISCSEPTSSDNEEFTVLNEVTIADFEGWKMIKTSDSCLVIAGLDSNLFPGIIKFDINGNKIWESFSSASLDDGNYITSLEETNSHGYLITGTYDYGTRFIMKFNTEGEFLWETEKDELGNWGFIKAVENRNNEIIAVTDYYIRKYDENGNILWTHFFDEGYSYSYDDVDFKVYQVYDCAITPDDDIIITYKSPISDLVKIVFNNEGNYVWGEFYFIDIKTNIKILVDGSQHYLFGVLNDIDEISNLFSISSKNDPEYYHNNSSTYEGINDFSSYINSVTMGDDGGILLTPASETLIKLEGINNYDWSYTVEDLDTNDHLYDAVHIDENKYALIGQKGQSYIDPIRPDTFLRFFQNN